MSGGESKKVKGWRFSHLPGSHCGSIRKPVLEMRRIVANAALLYVPLSRLLRYYSLQAENLTLRVVETSGRQSMNGEDESVLQ